MPETAFSERSKDAFMLRKKRIPDDFYKLFRTKNMESYMTCLVALYEENNQLLDAYGLTEEEGKAVIGEEISRANILWQIDDQEDEQVPGMIVSPAAVLSRLVKWGWLRSDYDERLNENVLSFPEYSQLYIEVFEKFLREDDSKERQSLLSIYSALYTYATDKDKNYQILSNALSMARSLGMMLSNMQDGMRGYFEELSASRNFMEIQKVLVSEINNSDSEKYAILTTTDSFYRYKESIKELMGQILRQNEERMEGYVLWQQTYGEESVFFRRAQFGIADCERAGQLIRRIEREFDQIEEKYNRLIEQKTVFAKRALARINYILQEGAQNEDSIVRLAGRLNLLKDEEQEEFFAEIAKALRFSIPYRQFCDRSFYKARQEQKEEYVPLEKEPEETVAPSIEEFVPKPLYTRQELWDFKKKNLRDGRFVTTKDTVSSVEDLEKLFFLWQEATENHQEEDYISLEEEFTGEHGFTYTGLRIAGMKEDGTER